MRHKIGTVFLAFACMGATSDATQLASGGVDEVKSALQSHEQRAEALRRLTQQDVEADVGAKILEASNASDKEEMQIRPIQIRDNEESFAKRLVGGEVEDGDRAARLGRLVDAVGSGAQTLDALQSFVDEFPAYRDGRLALARLQIMHEASANAVDTLQPLTTPLMEADHPDWQAWFWRGSAKLAMDDLESARKDLEVALAKDKSQAVVWIQLAVVEQELRNHTAALQYLDIAQQLDPTAGQIYLNRAYSLEHLGDFENAQVAYRSFLIADVQHHSRQMRAEVARRIGDLAMFDPNDPYQDLNKKDFRQDL